MSVEKKIVLKGKYDRADQRMIVQALIKKMNHHVIHFLLCWPSFIQCNSS